MKKIICILSLLLAFLMLFSACNTGDVEVPDTTVGESETEAETTAAELDIVKDKSSEYTVIYPASASKEVKKCAELLAKEIKNETGVFLTVKDDSEGPIGKEILVGETNRESSTPEASLVKGEYRVFMSGEDLVFLGYSEKELRYAVTYFVYACVNGTSLALDREFEYVHKTEYTVMRIAKYAENVKLYGRSSVTSSGATVDWSAGGIEFNVECFGDISITVSSTKSTYFAAYVNGEKVENLFLANEGTTTLKVAEGLDYGVYNVRLLKCANVVQANCIAESIKIDGKLLDAPAEKELLIEFIGDSITCGYGVIEGATSDSANVGTYKYCDATSAFAYLTAEKLGADWRIEGVSGAGMVSGYTTYTVPEIYYTHTWTRNKTKGFDFANERTPDVIVINLGTNDQSKGSDPEAFKTAVKTFVQTVREKYGKDVPIVWVYGMMNSTMSTHVKDALDSLGGTANGYYMVKLTKNQNGGNGHPDAAGQRTAADELTKFLKENVLK